MLTLSRFLGEGVVAPSFFPGAHLMPRDANIESPATVAARPDVPNAELNRAMDRYARDGDAASFRFLHDRLAPRLHGFLLRLSGDAALAGDLVQETFLRMHRARGAFAAGAAVVPWSIAIARNAFLDHTRRAQARGGRHDDSEELDQLPSPNGNADGEQVAVANETMQTVRATLARLPLAQREAFVLIRFEGLAVAEAAQILGTTEGAVKIRAFRAYEALRAALRPRDEEP